MNLIDIMQLLDEAVDEGFLPGSVVAKLKSNPQLLTNLMDALGGIDFNKVEANRIYAFLMLLDRSSSVEPFADKIIACLRGVVGRLKGITTNGALVVGCAAITSEIDGGAEVLLPFAPIKNIDIDANFEFVPQGKTPLYDAMVVTLVALRLLVMMAKKAGKRLVGMTYIVSDGDEFGSSNFDKSNTRETVTGLVTGRIKHRVAGVGIGENMARTFVELGLQADAVRDIGASDDAIEKLFDEIEASVTSTSQGGDTGGF